MSNEENSSAGGLLIVAGHAIYQSGTWYGGYPGEGSIYEQQVRDGYELCRREGYQAQALSGGHTRPNLQEVRDGKVTNSEAQGLFDFARDAGLTLADGTALIEPWARDSFENVLFSLFAY